MVVGYHHLRKPPYSPWIHWWLEDDPFLLGQKAYFLPKHWSIVDLGLGVACLVVGKNIFSIWWLPSSKLAWQWKMGGPGMKMYFRIWKWGYSIAMLVSGWLMVIWPRFQKVKKSPTQQNIQNSKSHHETSINRSALCHCLARPKVLKNRVIWCNCNGTLRSWKLWQELDDEQFNPIKSRGQAYLRARWVPAIDINEVLGPYLQLVGAHDFLCLVDF